MVEYGLADIKFVREASKNQIVVVPAFLSDDVLRCSFLPEYNRVVKEEYGNNETLRKLDGEGRGSTPFIAGLTRKILANYGVRPVISADDKDGMISEMVRGKYYTDFGDLVVHSPKETYGRNEKLLKNLIEVVEDKVGSIQFPFKVTGMIPVLWEEDNEKGYGLRFVPTEGFDYVPDGRLNLPTGTKFDTIDDKGIINPNENGLRTWYSKPDGLSRLYLNRNLDLYSYDGDLDDSNSDGRVVVVDAEGERLCEGENK